MLLFFAAAPVRLVSSSDHSATPLESSTVMSSLRLYGGLIERERES